ncbi:MAG: MMPL family transporter, partial [Acidimicrobiales bacterium]|nr:MMPL family transporter [Acidimicrobiales bacterium]
MFARLGRWCHDHKVLVPVAWLVTLILLGGVLSGIGTVTKTDFDLPDVESKTAGNILQDNFGGFGSGFGGRIVFHGRGDLRDRSVNAPLQKFLESVDKIDLTADRVDDVRVTSPFAPGGSRQISKDGTIAYAMVEFPPEFSMEDVQEVKKQIEERIPEGDTEVLLGGQMFAEQSVPNSEVLGLAFAMVILLLAFGSVLAMGLPIGVALFGIGAGTILAGFLSHLVSPPDFASALGMMIGLGVGIDYALFIVTRFRENLHRGHSIRDSTGIAIDTAGRAVLFAGTTVVISLLGMVIMGMSFVTGLAVNAAAVVAATMAASLTLLPALMALAGPRLEVTRWRGLVAAGFVAVSLVSVGVKAPSVAFVSLALAVLTILVSFLARPLRGEVPRRAPRPLRETFAYKWSRAIQHHPWRSAVGGTLVLIVLAIPLFGMHLGFSDEGNFPKNTETRQAYDLLAKGFGPGSNGPLIVTAMLPKDAKADELLGVAAALRADPGVASVSPPVLSGLDLAGSSAADVTPTEEQMRAFLESQLAANPRPKAVLFQVVPKTSPQDQATTRLVHRLRDDVLPAATKGTSIDASVGGFVAVAVDFSDYIAARLPFFLAAVLGLSFVLLMVVFRSLLVPLKAVVMNLLSIGAAYGVVVAVFQWGWGRSLIGLDEAVPIASFVPMMMFAILFGLSMDY